MVRKQYDHGKWRTQLHFEKIKRKHLPLLKKFSSYQKELEKYLVDDALSKQEWLIANTFLVFDKRNHFHTRKGIERLELLGYVTILNDSIRLDQSLREYFRNKGINYRSLPALKIGRLCVDNRYLGRGIGGCFNLGDSGYIVAKDETSASKYLQELTDKTPNIAYFTRDDPPTLLSESVGDFLEEGTRIRDLSELMKIISDCEDK
ncbi:hypothetical protein ACFL0V_02380 [Nanoarchaeota archaeon]